MPRPHTLLLDMDGTLVDASDAIIDGVLAFAAQLGVQVPTRDWVRGRIGRAPDETWALLGVDDPAEASRRYAAEIFPELVHRTEVLPGVREALEAFAARDCRLAAATNRTVASARAALEVTGLDALVSDVFGRDVVERPKPAPDMILHALATLDCPADRALMIGDTEADVLSARAAGVTVWAVLGGIDDGDGLRAAGADLILDGGLAAAPGHFDALWPAA